MKLITLLAVCLTVFLAESRITSLGTDTAQSVRNPLADNDFILDPSKGVAIDTADFRIRIAELSNFPVLAGTDTQSQVVRVMLKSGRDFIPHYHPRGTEILNVLRGRFRFTIRFEGLNPRVVTIHVREGQTTIFPQGLIHTARCVSKRDCMFLSNFNTADPGLVPVTV